MRTFIMSAITGSLALLLASSVALAQDRTAFRQEELDQMLAPVALYPDSLLSQVLMAATYPLEVVQAARWLRENPGFEGQDAVTAAEPMDWDPSVKSLTAFPRILAMMDEQLDWTERLGEAVLAQHEDVMNTVQGLRRRAEATGNLGSDDRMRVVRQGEAIVIEPAAPDVVYVPYYNPAVVYGPWWWPAYPPVVWTDPLAYHVASAHRSAFLWSTGIVISTGFFFSHFDWPQRQLTVVHVQRAHPARIRSAWRHDPVHRRGVPFRYTGPHARFEPHRTTGARNDAVRRGVARPEWRGSHNRPADIRQPRAEERRNDLPESREHTVNRIAPVPIDRRADRAQSPRADPRAGPTGLAQPERRNTRPDERGAPWDRRVRPGNAQGPAPVAMDRRGQNVPAPRPQAPVALPRPIAAAPATRAEPSPVAATPIASTQTATRQVPERIRSVPLRSGSDPARRPDVTRQNPPAPRPMAGGSAPRPSASAPNQVSRVENAQRPGVARPQNSPRAATRAGAAPGTRPDAAQRPRFARAPAENRR